jgi:hypothetical protein
MSSDCIIWPHGFTAQGYGCLRLDGKTVLAHRAIYEEYYGFIPENYEVHHTCENPACINIAHLVALSHHDHRMLHRPTHCPRGHEYDEANTYIDKKNKIRCKRCHRERMYAKRQGLRRQHD